MSRRVLLISYAFPPLLGAGTSRVLKFAKFLPKYGWDPHVLTVDDPDNPLLDYDDLDLSAEGIDENNVSRTRILNLDLRLSATGVRRPATMLLHDNKFGWWPFAVPQGVKIVRERNISLVFVSVPPLTTLSIAAAVKKRTGVPLVYDFRDLWVGNSAIPIYQNRFKHWLNAHLERNLLGKADAIVTVTEPWCEQLRKRTPDSAEKLFEVVENGYDPDDFHGLERHKPSTFTMTHTGKLYSRTRKVETLFAAVFQLLEEGSIDPARFELRMVTNVPAYIDHAAKSHAVSQVVRAIDYKPRRECLQEQLDSSVLLFLLDQSKDSRGRHTVKVFEYLFAKRPILALVPRDYAAAQLIEECGAGTVVPPDDVEAIKAAVLRYYTRFQADSDVACTTDENAISQFNREKLTGKLAALFNRVVEQKAAGTG